MFYGKTVYHGLAFLGVHIFPIIGGIASFYTQYFHCRDHTKSCFANLKFYIIACLCWIVLALSTWNTIRCHKNFGNFMAFYIRYEPSPKSDRKLVIRESSSMAKHSHIV
ncbi:7154_t:CDS:2 [Rhizophagus irregularis]|nr:7154_t:CDS:2 [Rhizophagus irregularis]